jgi:hypothetical protein
MCFEPLYMGNLNQLAASILDFPSTFLPDSSSTFFYTPASNRKQQRQYGKNNNKNKFSKAKCA